MSDTKSPGASSRSRRLVAGGVVLAALSVAAGYVWWPRALPEVPPIPSDIQDLEVRDYLEMVREKVVANPGSAEAWWELGLALLANLFDTKADACFAEASRLDPHDIRWPYARAVIASKRNPGTAVPLLRQAAAATSPNPQFRSIVRLFLAETLLEQGELDEAERLFHEEAAQPSSQARATLGLGLVARARGDAATATEYLTAARQNPSSRIQATIQLAALARTRGDNATAAALEKQTRELSDDRPWPDPILEGLAQHKMGRRARERAISELEQERQFEAAAKAYLRQIEERPTAAAYVGAAVNCARIQEFALADRLLGEALRLDPESSQAHYTKALVYFIRAEREWANTPGSPAAKEWFREVIDSGKRSTELKPDHAQAYLMWGLALNYLGEPNAAVEPLTKGVACRPELFPLQLALGEALLESGRNREAEKALTNAQRLNPVDPRVVRALERLRTRER